MPNTENMIAYMMGLTMGLMKLMGLNASVLPFLYDKNPFVNEKQNINIFMMKHKEVYVSY